MASDSKSYLQIHEGEYHINVQAASLQTAEYLMSGMQASVRNVQANDLTASISNFLDSSLLHQCGYEHTTIRLFKSLLSFLKKSGIDPDLANSLRTSVRRDRLIEWLKDFPDNYSRAVKPLIADVHSLFGSDSDSRGSNGRPRQSQRAYFHKALEVIRTCRDLEERVTQPLSGIYRIYLVDVQTVHNTAEEALRRLKNGEKHAKPFHKFHEAVTYCLRNAHKSRLDEFEERWKKVEDKDWHKGEALKRAEERLKKAESGKRVLLPVSYYKSYDIIFDNPKSGEEVKCAEHDSIEGLEWLFAYTIYEKSHGQTPLLLPTSHFYQNFEEELQSLIFPGLDERDQAKRELLHPQAVSAILDRVQNLPDTIHEHIAPVKSGTLIGQLILNKQPLFILWDRGPSFYFDLPLPDQDNRRFKNIWCLSINGSENDSGVYLLKDLRGNLKSSETLTRLLPKDVILYAPGKDPAPIMNWSSVFRKIHTCPETDAVAHWNISAYAFA
ncbi:hypothetical protein V5O48_017367 [Marasmius crinis-equi]|uniref:Uncharacterized protein n=1 Tax=Marasmius crinis-equi TaxID=585013 RepID=A0ABR3EP68_9AGAR